MAVVVLGLCLLLCAVSGAPVKKTYDQRQQGELNIHAQLDNIVIVLIPTSKISISQQDEDNVVPSSTGQLIKPEKSAFLQFLQKHMGNELQRFHDSQGVPVKEEKQYSSHDENEVNSQEVVLKIEKDQSKDDNEEEVLAIVKEMKPGATEKTLDPPKSEGTEDTPIKEHSTVSETMQETVIKVSIPEELKDAAKKTQEELKKEEKDRKKPGKEVNAKESSSSNAPLKTESVKEKQDSKANLESFEVKVENSSRNKPDSILLKEKSLEKESSGSTLEDLIKPLAAKESQPSSTREEMGDIRKSLVEGARKEKVIRYKPESKWAPGLVDLLGPARPRGLEQRFNPLCSPGVWDPELKTCIMPGETRSRNDLARFLEAMRFGIALPTQ